MAVVTRCPTDQELGPVQFHEKGPGRPPRLDAAPAHASVLTPTARAAEWLGGLFDLLTRRPDLVGVYALADLALDSIKSSA